MTDQDQRLDLSALDPLAETERWSMLVDSTMKRVDVVLARRGMDPLTLIASWMRRVTTSVLVILGLLVPVELILERRETRVEQIERLAQLSATALRTDGELTGDDLARALSGGRNP